MTIKLDWQHIALFVVAAVCLAALLWFAFKTGNPALIGVAVPSSGLFITQILSMFKSSPSDVQTTTVSVTEPKPPAAS